MSHLRLVKEFSDSQYPYRIGTSMAYPYELRYRSQVREKINNALQLLDIREGSYKVVEEDLTFEMMFQHHFDARHYNIFFTSDPSNRYSFNFGPTVGQEEETKEYARIANWLKTAVRKSRQTDIVNVEIDMQNKVVHVLTPDIHSYFGVWKEIPYDRRFKITGLEPS